MNALPRNAGAWVLVAGALLAIILLAAVPAPTVAAAPPVVAAPQGKVDIELRGAVTEVWVSSPGTVTFRVHGTDAKGKVATMWFKSPSDKDLNTLLENLALGLIRHSVTSGTELLVEAKESSGDDGSSADKAFSFLRIGMRPAPTGAAPR